MFKVEFHDYTIQTLADTIGVRQGSLKSRVRHAAIGRRQP